FPYTTLFRSVNDRLVGSKIIGQQFADVVTGKNGKVELDKNGNPVTTPDPRYFQTRPSPTTPPDNAAAATFSNLGPNNLTTEQEIAANVKAYLGLGPTLRPSPPPRPGPGRRRRQLGLGRRPRYLGAQRAHPSASHRGDRHL